MPSLLMLSSDLDSPKMTPPTPTDHRGQPPWRRFHIAIRQERYVAGTRDHPEVGVFTQTHASQHPVPWGRIQPGEVVYMKWTGGPIVGRARVSGFRQFSRCTPEQLRDAVAGYGLHDLNEYWGDLQQSKPTLFGLAIYLDSEEWLPEPITPAARSRGSSWIVVASPKAGDAWLHDAPAAETSRMPPKAPSRTISAKLRFLVFRRDQFRCVYCGRRAPEVVLHADHRVPWSKGGPSNLDNLVTACSVCNAGKGILDVDIRHGGSSAV